MRTTIEITDEQRAKLLEMAARRGQKGFSRLVQEAIDVYLDKEAKQQRNVADAIAALGTMSNEDAEALRDHVRRIRSEWRD